jgi:hypothetical protein
MHTETTIELPKNLLKAASTDKTREVLHVAYVDAKERAIICTNGRMLSRLNIPGDAPVKKCRITPEDWKIAKAMHSKAMLYDYAAGTLNGHPIGNGGEYPYNYPNWKQVIPSETPDLRICFSPKLLADLVASMGGEDKPLILECAHPTRQTDPCPIVARSGDGFGVLMPMRAEENVGILIPINKTTDEMLAEIKSQKATIESLKAALADAKAAPPERSPAPADATASPPDATTEPAPMPEPDPEETEITGSHFDPTEAPPERSPAPPEVSPTPTARGGDAKPAKAPRTPTPPATSPPVLTRNQEKNGIELRFNGKPDDVTRERMKAAGFRCYFKQPGIPWCAKYSEEAWVFATNLAAMPAHVPVADARPARPVILPDF